MARNSLTHLRRCFLLLPLDFPRRYAHAKRGFSGTMYDSTVFFLDTLELEKLSDVNFEVVSPFSGGHLGTRGASVRIAVPRARRDHP